MGKVKTTAAPQKPVLSDTRKPAPVIAAPAAAKNGRKTLKFKGEGFEILFTMTPPERG